MSFTPYGMPWRGPRYRPAEISSSASAARARARSSSEGHHAVQGRAVALEPPEIHFREFLGGDLAALQQMGKMGDGPKRCCFQIEGSLHLDRAHPNGRRGGVDGDTGYSGIEMKGEWHLVPQGLAMDLLVPRQVLLDLLHHGLRLFRGDLQTGHPGRV